MKWLWGVQVQQGLRGLVDEAVMLRLAHAMEPSTLDLRMPGCVRGSDAWQTVRPRPPTTVTSSSLLPDLLHLLLGATYL